MRQKAILFLLLGIVIFVGSIVISTPRNNTDSLEKRYQEWQNNYSDYLESTVLRLQKDSSAIKRCIESPLECSFSKKIDQSKEGILLYSDKDSLIYWTGNNIPSPQLFKASKKNVIWNDNQAFIIKELARHKGSILYFLSSPAGEMTAAFGVNYPEQYFSFKKQPSNFAFMDKSGEALFFLDIKSLPQAEFNHWLAFILYTLSLISLFLGAYFFTELLFHDHSNQKRVSYSILAFLLIRFITALIFYRGIDMNLYNQAGETQIGQLNLGVLWINILLFYAIVLIITKRLKFEIKDVYHKWTKYLIYGIAYLAMIASCMLVAYVGQSIIFNSRLGSNLARIGDWSVDSIISLIACVIFIVTVFHLAWFLLKSINTINFSLPGKMLALLAACVASLALYPLVNIHLHPFPFYLIVILFVFLMDLFIEEEQANLNWLFIWIAVASACSTSILYKYYVDKVNASQKSILLSLAYSETVPASANKEAKLLPNVTLDYAVYIKGKRQNYYGEYYPLIYPYDKVTELKMIETYDRDNRYETIYRASNDIVVVSSRIKNSFITPISWYAYMFVIWIVIAILMAAINTRWEFLPVEWKFRMTQLPSLRRRIQFNIMMITIGSFTAVCILSYIYLKNTANQEIEYEAKNKLSIIIDDIEAQLGSGQGGNRAVITTVQTKAEMHRAKVNLYDTHGKTLVSASKSEKYRLAYSDWKALQQKPDRIHTLSSPGDYEYISPIISNQGRVQAYLGYNLSYNPITGPFNNFLNTLLKLYIFLGVIALGISLFVSNSITNPLKTLGEKLKELKLGKKNQRLDWNSPDELGDLIQNYNLMIDKLESSAEILAAQERDTAWREMAKQVAHEIKNPLTPMRLSLQHLQFTIANDPERGMKMIDQVAETIIEQIDNLTRIATGFGDFAKMPTPENIKLSLNTVVMHVHDLFRKRADMDIELQVPINDVIVFADKDQVSRIITNLLKNAIQAIPHEKNGHIIIRLYIQDDNAVISIQDNGSGIPDEMRDKIFEPNFTSKSSGTGLGLAMCANMIEGFNGRIYFETEVDVGSTFYMEIPLMHAEERNRIYL